jgi:alkylation response protein AidB-like acyl-CoA dehydrogenase
VHLLSLRTVNELQGVDAVPRASAAEVLAGELALDARRFAKTSWGCIAGGSAVPLHVLMGDARMMAVVDGTSVLNHLVVGRRMLPPDEVSR